MRGHGDGIGKGRVIWVSNRLPVTLHNGPEGPTLVASSGGLASSLSDLQRDLGGRWVGWVGDLARLGDAARAQVLDDLAQRGLDPVPLTPTEVSLYYDGYSNAVLWPLFHYLLDKVRLDAGQEWRAYKAVNERFADVVARDLTAEDTVWVHDYQLMLLPGLLRQRVPGVRIGFFLHVPWPASDVFRILPAREEILASLLGADLIGFHAEAYRHNFIHSAAKVLGIDLGIDSVSYAERNVKVGVYPISIDVGSFERQSSAIDTAVAQIRAETPGKQTLLGVDRLDYTKGVPRRLLAFERLLEREPAMRGKLHYIQLAVPTRERVDAYAELRSNVNELVGRINSQYGSATGSPIQLLYRSVSPDELLALYRAAHVMIVTPLRDGMNLVAKEYVAARTDELGALVLSEFAGASAELEAALVVNPYDIDSTASALRRALTMTEAEQRVRMRRLRAQVSTHTVAEWARSFLEDLQRDESAPSTAYASADAVGRAIERLRGAEHRALLFDYDGTLVPIAALPELATPDDDLLRLIARLAELPATDVHIVSGRSRESLEEWMGGLPVALHIEHGFWSRDKHGEWRQATEVPSDILLRAEELMRRKARRAAGMRVEVKRASVAFHYRNADPFLAEARLRALRAELPPLLGPQAELLEGRKVLEVRLR
ncbi:MAG TPA: bifunctional alpha,alpha-trehalose-phosphate synthase (UDP-forming)/trehalose-phosphatase, partial [Polyangiales bacterium]